MLRYRPKVLLCRLNMFHLQWRMVVFHRKMLRLHAQVERFHAPAANPAHAKLPSAFNARRALAGVASRERTIVASAAASRQSSLPARQPARAIRRLPIAALRSNAQ